MMSHVHQLRMQAVDGKVECQKRWIETRRIALCEGMSWLYIPSVVGENECRNRRQYDVVSPRQV